MKRKSPIRHVVKASGKKVHTRGGKGGSTKRGAEYAATVLAGKSSFIKNMVHSGSTLSVSMKGGEQYISTGVSKATFGKIKKHVEATGSMGKAFNKLVKGKYPGRKL